MKLRYAIIYVQNVAETVVFYERAFGLTHRFIHVSGTYAEMETGETALAFADEAYVDTCHHFMFNNLNNPPAGAEIGFVSDNVQEAFNKAVASGASPYVYPMTKPWGQTVSYVRDNNGFLIEICSAIG